MTRLIVALRWMCRRDEGQDLLEYALLVALIALVAAFQVAHAGRHVGDVFNTIAGQI